MSNNNHSAVAGFKALDNFKNLPCKFGVKCRCRLIKTKNIRLKSAKSKKAKQATIRWAKVKNVDGYVVEYSTKANMKSAKKKNVKASTISLTVKNLKKGKKYYVRVRGYKVIDGQKVYTQYSAKKAVKIKK